MISVIVPARVSRPSPLSECLSSLLATPFAEREVIVVDNGSDPEAIAAARRPQVRLIPNTHLDAGCAGPRNAGAETATGDILLFVDADVVVERHAFDLVARTFAEDGIDAVFGVETPDPGYANFSSLYRNLWMRFSLMRLPRRPGLLHSSCMAIRADVFRRFGGFDERFRECSVEDVDLGRRIVAAGGAIVRDERLSFQHRRPYDLAGLLSAERSRAAALAALQLRALLEGVTGVGRSYTVPPSHRIGVAAFGLSVLALAVAVVRADAVLALVAAAGSLVAVALRADLLVYLYRERGPAFALRSLAFQYADYSWVLIGALEGVRDVLLGRR